MSGHDELKGTAKLNLNIEQTVELPVFGATIGQNVIDVRGLAKHNMWSYDPAFMATAACESKITYIDGDKGELLYRGYPIEELANDSTHLESAYLLLHGELPTLSKFNAFKEEILKNATVPNHLAGILDGFDKTSHPMAMLIALVSGLSYTFKDAMNIKNADERLKSIYALIAKMPTLVAMCHRKLQGLNYVEPRNEHDYAENFLYMLFADSANYKVNPILAKAMDRIFLLHADHEQNASTSTVRMAGSSGTHPYAAIAAGIACLWGPSHGGANEAVLKMLEEINTNHTNIEEYIQGVKDKKYRLMGFGHRVYKNMDPRANIMRETCYEVLKTLGKQNDPLFELAMNLEKVALSDNYFIEKKLYPNVDFYSGIILRAIGIPTNMFTPIFALARTVGWLAQLDEMLKDEDFKISRPRQLYTGYTKRNYVAISNRI